MSIDKIRAKVLALLAKASDQAASESEAAACMAMARKLMEQYSISENDLKNVTSDSFREASWKVKQTRHGNAPHPVDLKLGGIIAKFCGCRAWLHNNSDGSQEVKFFGLEADVALAEWLRLTLVTTFDENWETYKKVQRDTRRLKTLPQARQSFTIGFADAIAGRLEKWMLPEKPDSVEAKEKNALVVKKYDLVTEELAKRGIKLKVRRSANVGAFDSGAFGAGGVAGNSATVGRGVGNGGTLLLK